MLFLFFDDIEIDLVSYALRYLAAKICGFLYPLIAGLFELFINISKVQILSSNQIAKIYQRVTLILTIVMVFYVTFQTVKYVIEPDTMTDKEKGAGKIVTKMIISVVLLAMVPTIFEYAFKVQNTIIDNQIIPKAIMGTSSTSSSDAKYMGRNFAATTFSLFYGYTFPEAAKNDTNENMLNNCEKTIHLREGEFKKLSSFSSNNTTQWRTNSLASAYVDSLGIDFNNIPDEAFDKANYIFVWTPFKGSEPMRTVGTNLCTLKKTGKFYDITYGIGGGSGVKDHEDDEIPLIKFEGLMAIIVGGFMIYVLALYCIDLGTRAAQLAFLQIIAPIPIIGYLSPKKDNMFDKWVKQCLTTYADLFLRTILIYFVLFLCNILSEAKESGDLFRGIPSNSDKTLIYIAIILGLLLFAQKAPKLLQELFPKMGAASGNFGLKAGERTAPLKGVAKLGKKAAKAYGMGRRVVGGAAGLVGGAIGGGSLRNMPAAALAGAKRGFSKNDKGVRNGSVVRRFKNAKAAGGKVKENRADVLAAGGTIRGSERQQEHFQNIAQAQDRKVNNLESVKKKKDGINGAINEVKALKQLDSLKAAATAAGDSAEVLRLEAAIKKVQKAARSYAYKPNARSLDNLRTEIAAAASGTSLETLMNDAVSAEATRRGRALNEDEKKSVQNAFLDSIIETGSPKWDTAKTAVESARRTVTDQSEEGVMSVIGDKKITVKRGDPPSDVQVAIKDLTEDEIAQYIGDITEAADAAAADTKDSDAYRKAHTNAKGSKNNNGSGS